MNNPKVYLLKAISEDKSFYKIGFTRGSVNKRIIELQTGCPFKIEVVNTYDSQYSSVLEKILHNLYRYYKTHGEWFELSADEESNFLDLCKKYENIQIFLEKKDSL